jgi:hypothetical protein
MNHVLEALLYRKADREAFLAGDLARFALSAEERDALSTIDKEQLETAAAMARDHVFERSHRGVGTLVQMFRETIEAWLAASPGRLLPALADDFVASPHFHAYRTHAFAGQGIGLEEAFYRFAEDESIGSAAVRLRECAVAILRGLLITPRPVFSLPAFVRSAPRGFYVVAPADAPSDAPASEPMLYAALDGKYIEGPITPYIARLLTHAPGGESVEPLPEPERRAVANELVRLGLLPSSG